MQELIKITQDLATDPEYYHHWFQSVADPSLKLRMWDFVWNQAATTNQGNAFVEGLYDFYCRNGYLTQRQFHFLIRQIFGIHKKHSLSDRL